MAKQEGILPIKGSIDNITFYKSKDGYLVRKRGGLTAEKIATDPAFQRTRENNAEFGRAGVAGRLLRTSMRALIAMAGDSRSASRITTLFMKVVKSDAVSLRGERNVLNGDMSYLIGADFNINGKLGTTFYAPFTPVADRAGGMLTVTIPSFVPQNMIAAPNGATHFKLVVGGAAIDFAGGTYVSDVQEHPMMAIGNQATGNISLNASVGAASPHPLFLLLGIQFYQEINGGHYLLKNGGFNALAIVAAEKQ